jgi:hypothetical protein
VRSPDLSSVLLARVPSAGDPDEHRLREEVAGRLERACAHLEPDRFADLVESIVELKLRWARRDVEEMAAQLPAPQPPRAD